MCVYLINFCFKNVLNIVKTARIIEIAESVLDVVRKMVHQHAIGDYYLFKFVAARPPRVVVDLFRCRTQTAQFTAQFAAQAGLGAARTRLYPVYVEYVARQLQLRVGLFDVVHHAFD